MVDQAVDQLDAIPSNYNLKVAICFKAIPEIFDPCDGTVTSNNWLSLTDDLFAYAANQTKHLGTRIEFILDGSGVPSHKCLYDRWRPWVATVSLQHFLLSTTLCCLFTTTRIPPFSVLHLSSLLLTQ